MRYSELLRLLAGVSQKMLTQTLRSLERDGLVTRTATPTVPVTVSYELTDLGLSLHQTMRGIKTWAETHMDDVLANREAKRRPHGLNQAKAPHPGGTGSEPGAHPVYVQGTRQWLAPPTAQTQSLRLESSTTAISTPK